MDTLNPGLAAALQYPLFKALANRRSRRISQGIPLVAAGKQTFTSRQEVRPLSALEEAVLIAATGVTGRTVPDRPFQDGKGQNILGTPNLNMIGRAAGSTDNARGTHFFLFNDEGTYFLRQVESAPAFPVSPADFLQRAEQSKQQREVGLSLVPGREGDDRTLAARHTGEADGR